ncbi:MAG: S9 family peptidase [Candidatus Acidiferrum sp.]
MVNGRRVVRRGLVTAAGFAWCGALMCFCVAVRAQDNAAQTAKSLTVERIYSLPSLSGELAQGLKWRPDGKSVSYLESLEPAAKTAGKGKKAGGGDSDQKRQLWTMDTVSGERQVLIPAEKLKGVIAGSPAKPSQRTGLGRLTPEEYQWAPSGQAILFQGTTTLTWFDTKTQSARKLVTGAATLADPKISPDGRFVTFVRDHNVWVVSVANGKERAVTQGGTEEIRKGELDWVYPEELDLYTAYWWAPDSSAIAYLEMDERKVPQYPLVDFASYEGATEMQRYPIAGGHNPVVSVFVVSLKGGAPHRMDSGSETDVYIPRVAWLPDSLRVAIERLNRPQTVLELLVADATSGKSRVVLTDKDLYWINVSAAPYFFSDGKRFLWTSERSGYRHIYLYDLSGKELAQLTKGDWEVFSVNAVAEAQGAVYFTATEKSALERHLYRVSLDGSGFKRITLETGTHSVAVAPGAAGFIDTYSTSATPPRQYLVRGDGSRIGAIHESSTSELDGYRLSPMEFLSVRAHDGMMLNASIIKPLNFDAKKKYPVIVFTYGGPDVQVVRNAWSGNTFLWNELMAEKGFIIFSLDNRGSAGRGHLFEEPIHLRFGAQEMSDQHDGVMYLKSLPYVDPQRIGIWGWTYGGHMTLHAVFGDPLDYKVGFAGGPVSDWHYYDSIYTERYLGLLPANEQGYDESSPVEKVKSFQGKLLIAHGTGDDNVHFEGTLALVDRLIAEGKYVELIPFPGRGHGINDLTDRRVLMQRVMQFFIDNL